MLDRKIDIRHFPIRASVYRLISGEERRAPFRQTLQRNYAWGYL